MKQKQIIIFGVILILVVGAGIFYSMDLRGIVVPASVVPTSNVGTVGDTTITCPVGYSVISTVGGTPDTLQEPKCKAPNPSVEEFSCGDSVIDASGMVHIIECTMVTPDTSSSWSGSSWSSSP